MEKELLSIQEASRMLGVKPITLRKWDREGKLKAIRLGARGDRRYKKEDLENFLSQKATAKKQPEWQEYIRSGATYRIASQVIDSITEGQKEYFDRGLNYLMCYFEGDTLFWYYDDKDLYTLGKVIVNKLNQSPSFYKEFFSKWEGQSQKILMFLEKNPKEILKTKSKDQLAIIYQEYTNLLSEFGKIVYSIDATDETLMVDITNKLKSKLLNQPGKEYTTSEFNRVYNILTAPSHLSYLNNERKMILKLYKECKEKNIAVNNPLFKKKSNRITELFWWTGLGWGRGKAKKFNDVVSVIEELENSKANIAEELEEISNYQEKTKVGKEKVLEKYGLTKDQELISWLNLYDKLVYYHDFRKEIQMKSNFWEYMMIDEISFRTKVPSYLLDWCSPQEIIDLTLSKKNVDEHDLNQRSSKFLYLYIEGDITKLSGKEAVKKHSQVIGSQVEEVRDLQGLSVSPGTVTAEAHVAITTDSVLRIKPGQVLVTGMTMPDYVPAMRKASAIITDEGGITCHAAIISRELGIPCIVGTKYATRLIKTGDRIEVRANHGVVRILDKQGTEKNEKENKYNWFLIQERGDNIPLNPGIQPLFEKYTTLPERFLNQPKHHALLVFRHGGGRYYPDADEWKMAEKAAFKKVRQNPNYMQQLLEEYKQNLPKLTAVNDKIKSQDLSKLSNITLWKLFSEYYQTYKEVYPPCEGFQFWLSQPLTDYLDEYLRNILRKRHQEKLFSEYFEILITPPEIPFTTKEERALLDIALEISEDSHLAQFFMNKEANSIVKELKLFPRINTLIDNHKEKFEWVPFDYGNPTWSKEDFIQAISNMLKKEFDILQRIHIIDSFYSNISERQKELYLELDIDKHHQQLYRALQIDAHTIDYKKETLTQSNFAAKKMMEEIGRRTGIPKDYLMRLGYEDIKDILEKNIAPDIEKLKSRWEQTVVFIENGKSVVMEGKEGEEFLIKQGLTETKLTESNEVKGITASGGKAIGNVKVITSPKEFNKMQTGDILVTFMTTPEYVPILRKAAAIITNEGGITCHAAIVSRELNIPCIVGTKNAVDIFKDGDKVEVRANHGIAIKIIDK